MKLEIDSFVKEDYFIIQYTTPFNEFSYINSYDPKILREEDLISSSETINVAYLMSIRNLTLINPTNQMSELTAILNQR